MVQIIPANPKRSFGESFLSGALKYAPGLIDEYMKEKKAQTEKLAKAEKYKKLGLDPELDPAINKLLLEQRYEQEHPDVKKQADLDKIIQETEHLKLKNKIYGNLLGFPEEETAPQNQGYSNLFQNKFSQKQPTTPQDLLSQNAQQSLLTGINAANINPEQATSALAQQQQEELIPPKQKKIFADNWSKMTPQQKAQLSLVMPQLATQLQRNEEFEYKKQQDIKSEQETAKKEKKQDAQFFHKETEKYDSTLSELATAAEKKNRAIDRQVASIDKISKWDRFSAAVFGNTPFGDLLKSKNAQEFDFNTLAQLEGQRQILGGILSDADIRLLMQKIVTASKNPEANKTIAQAMKFENDLVIAKRKIANDIKKENDGYRPPNFEDQIEKRYIEQYGDAIKNHVQQLNSLPDDPKLLKDIAEREKVPPGTPLDQNVAEKYLKLASKYYSNPEERRSVAIKWARDDGYQY